MKRSLWFVALSSLLLFSCSSEVEIYTDYKSIPVVFGLLDVKADTNFIKITKTFCGSNDNLLNANEVAQIFDSCNYPGKLDAYIVELRSVQGQEYQPTGRKIFLDTVTIHNKHAGVFYAPHQKLYYTTEKFYENNAANKYRYRLYVIKPDFDTVTSETAVVSGDVDIYSSKMNFSSTPTDAHSTMLFSSTEGGMLYEITMKFNYREGHSGGPMTRKEVSWTYGAKNIGEYERVPGNENLYRHYYSPNSLFILLEQAIGNDTVWDVNHPNVVRYIDDFVVSISAAGESLSIYSQYLQTAQSNFSLSTEYSNIKGGCGLFSSRVLVSHKVELSPGTKHDLFREPWGFLEQ